MQRQLTVLRNRTCDSEDLGWTVDARSSHVVMHGFLGDVALEGATLRLGEATCLSQLCITNATTVLHDMLNALIGIETPFVGCG